MCLVSRRYYSGWCDKHEAGKVIETKGTLSYTRHGKISK